MERAESINPQSGDVILLVGTVKGVFIFTSDCNRGQFRIAGPYFKGQAVFSTAYLRGAARPGSPAARRLLLRAARRVHLRQSQSCRALLRYARRPTVRVARRGRKLGVDRRLAARGAMRESCRGRLSTAMLFHLPSALRRWTGDKEVIEMSLPLDMPMTVGEAFVMLGRDYPAIRQRVLDDQNNIRRHVNVFVNGENVRFAQGGATQVSNDSEVWIYPALSGG